MSNTNWYQKTREETLALLATRVDYGLDQAEVKQRQQRFSNQLQTMTRSNPVKILINQFTDTMVLVLLAATVVSGLIGAMADAVTIMAIVIINAILGFIQEYRAERSLEAIKKLSAPSARVLRQGHKISVPASELVPGDIVFLETGDRVPADIRLLETTGLESDESLLTGESVPVYKEAQQLYDRETSLAEQANMLFMGTSVTRGRGSGVVVNTGMDTVMGQIARMVQEETQQMTPMQIKLDQLGKYLIIICIAVCIVVSLMGIFRGEAIMTMLMAGISLAVAAIPEGLPAIVTVVLALGVQRMADKNAIVRRLSAVETLGCTTVICSDKTGTLTQNKMTVVKMASMDAVLRLDTNSKNKRWLNVHGNKYCDPLQKPGTRWLMDIALNCNNAAREKKGQKWVYNGDPTEIALLEMAHYNGLSQTYERIGEIPFDSERKKMSVLVRKEGQQVLLVKGALEVLISSCTAVIKEDKTTRLDNSDRKKIQEIQTEWAADGLRVLGFAFKILPAADKGITIGVEMEQELVLCGIIGLLDPPRPGVAEAVRQCRKARIIPIMITGDHPVTAGAIARQIGLADGAM
nr:HAD-IC family P-type ATPase [Syntrophomonas palmitatica]